MHKPHARRGPGRKIRVAGVRRIEVNQHELGQALKLQLTALASGIDPARVSSDAHDHGVPIEINSTVCVARLRMCNLNPNGCGWAMLQLGASSGEATLKRERGASSKQRIHVVAEVTGAKPGGKITVTRIYPRIAFTETIGDPGRTRERTAQMHAIIVNGWEPGDSRLAHVLDNPS